MFGTRHDYQVAGRGNDATTRTLTNDNECIALTRHTLPERGERKIFFYTPSSRFFETDKGRAALQVR